MEFAGGIAALGASLVATGWLLPQLGYMHRRAGSWHGPPRWAELLFRRGHGPINLALVVMQIWGWTLLSVALLAVLGVVASPKTLFSVALLGGLVAGSAVVAGIWLAGERASEPTERRARRPRN